MKAKECDKFKARKTVKRRKRLVETSAHLIGALRGKLLVKGDIISPGFAVREVKMPLTVEVERETDKRWIAEVTDLPGVMADGATRKEAVSKAQVLALRVLADRMEHGEKIPAITKHFVVAA